MRGARSNRMCARRASAGSAGHHRSYPYLLRSLQEPHVNQVWMADITYIPMAHGFLYLVAIIRAHGIGQFRSWSLTDVNCPIDSNWE